MLARLMDSNWFPAIYLLVLICMLRAGVLLARKWRVQDALEDWRSGGLLNAIIGFFSLLLAFTLSSSASSNKARISYIQQHRGAIANLYRQSFLFDDSLRRSVKEYSIKALEIKLTAAHSSAEETKDLYRNSALHNNAYLRSMSELVKDNAPSHAGARTIVTEMGKIIDLDAQVHFSNQERTPAVVMLLLLIGSWTISFLMGFTSVLLQKRHYLGPVIFTCLTALTVLIIQDMDNPNQGIVKPPYGIYRDLLLEIKADQDK